jgi:hypothetical protein
MKKVQAGGLTSRSCTAKEGNGAMGLQTARALLKKVKNGSIGGVAGISVGSNGSLVGGNIGGTDSTFHSSLISDKK